ncbi:MAG: DUF4157 domain-containing protein [Acidobacteriota bacterium]
MKRQCGPRARDRSTGPFATDLPRRAKGTVPPVVDDVLRSSGQPLDAATSSVMKTRFNQDFSRLRVHTGSHAAESARSVAAQAFTVGRNVVFGAGQYSPETPAGRRLLTHELTHVAQQKELPDLAPVGIVPAGDASEREADRAAAGVTPIGEIRQRPAEPVLQRLGVWQAITRFFGGGTFEPKELKDYLAFLDTTHKIEGDFDSDNKARDVVRRWKAGEKDFQILPVFTRALLIEEMITGHPSEADQEATMDLLRESIVGERTAILQKVGLPKLKGALDGKELKELLVLADQEQDDLSLEEMGTWSVEGILKNVFRHGDVKVIDFLIRESYKILSFTGAFDKWEYPDGRIEETLIPGLWGNTCRVVRPLCPRAREIRLNVAMTNAEASATLVHEVAHAEVNASEVDARVEGEKYRIRHGMAPAEPDYRKPDGSIDEPAIRKEVTASPHYNPVGRTRVGRRYEGEKEVRGWHLPAKKVK